GSATMGLLQVIGPAEPLRGVKIRYRLVKREPDTPVRQAAQADTSPPSTSSNGVRDGADATETSGLARNPGNDRVIVEDLALHMIVAIRDKDDTTLRSLAIDRTAGWRDALPTFALDLRERYRQLTGKDDFDLRPADSLVKGDYGVVRCTGPAVFEGRCVIFSFVKAPEGWKNCKLQISTEDESLENHLAGIKVNMPPEPPAAHDDAPPVSDAAPPVEPRDYAEQPEDHEPRDTSQSWDPWAEALKNGNFRRMNGDLNGALENYRLSLAEAEKKSAGNAPFQTTRQAESHAGIGDVLCELGSLEAARDSYQTAVSLFEQLPAENLVDTITARKLLWTRVKLGDVLMALGDRPSALTAWRGGPDEEKEFKENAEAIGGTDYQPTEPFNPRELRRLAEKDHLDAGDLRRMMWLINRAGAERDGGFSDLLERKDLREENDVDLALTGYDYSINANPKALDRLLARLASETVGSDSSTVVALSFVDEWDRSVKAVNAHFIATDGAGGLGENAFWCTRFYLFPRGLLGYRGETGEGAPISKD
ncbi:MAG: tetratricopeptide repeat protein, partial [Verrucomicrobiae bacterium]|nr:tetratricopeptide repeat protein [Verrucomicrobiae bacterium]